MTRIFKQTIVLGSLLLCFGVFLTAQKKETKTDAYSRQWQQVDDFAKRELPRSADSVATNIHKRALKEKNTGEAAKAFMAQQGFRRQFTENQWSDLQAALQGELAVAWEPYRQIVHSLGARLIINYYNSRRWQYYQTQTSGDSTQLETMNAKQLQQLALGHINQSLQNAKLLQAIGLQTLPQIIEKGTKPAHLRPTLWDFLTFEAIAQLDELKEFNTDYFGEQLTINASHFASPEVFSTLSFTTGSSSDLTEKSLLLWQQLTKVRLNSPTEKEAFINTYFERVLWMANRYEHENKDSLLFAKFGEIEQMAQGLPISALAVYHKALAYQNITAAKGETDFVKTIHILEKAAKAWPKSEGGLLCQQQIDIIKVPTINITAESVYYPNRQGIFNIEAKNCATLYAFVMPIKTTIESTLRNIDSDSLLAIYSKSNNIRPIALTTPKFIDYRSHNFGAALPALNAGSYLLVVCDKPKLQNKNCVFSFSRIDVTSLGITTQNIKNGTKLTVVDRLTGKPLLGVSVTPYFYTYHRHNDNSPKEPEPLVTTDQNGQVVIATTSESRQQLGFEVKKGNDVYFFRAGYVYYHSFNNETVPDRTTLFIFTDRKIYRPGQTVHFKAILMNSKDNEANALTNNTVELALRDVNGNELQKLKLTTNNFGSCSGTFQIPTNVLTGDWAITSWQGSSTFMVEAYKRPKFTVELTPPTNAYKAGDSIAITGKALAYSGSPLMNATVKYSIKQGMRFMPYYRSAMPNAKANQEIALGTVSTDSKGGFTISFKSSDPNGGILTYDQLNISVDVTDINGETQSESLAVPIGLNSRQLSIDLPYEVDITQNKPLKVTPTVTNLSGKPLDGKGGYKVYRLVPNSTIKPNAFWRKPEVQLAPDSVHQQFVYANHSAQYTEVVVDSGRWETQTSKAIEFSQPNILQPGKLRLAFWLDNDTANATGNTINLVKWADSPMPTDEPLELRAMADKNTIKILTGSALHNTKIHLEVVAAGNPLMEKTLELNKQQSLITIPSSGLEGQMVKARVWAIHNNRFYQYELQLNIPDTTRTLAIKTETFREKLSPGNVETIKLKVLGNNGKAITAELLANMYDASLDAFVPNFWSMNIRHPKYFSLFALNFYGQGTTYDQSYSGYPTNNGSYWLQYPHLKDEMLWVDDSRPSLRSIRYFGQPNRVADELNIIDDDIEVAEEAVFMMLPPTSIDQAMQGKVAGVATQNDGFVAREEEEVKAPQPVQVRRNLNETAFFYPHLTTDSLGNVSFTYTVPKSLTKWKLMALAHNKVGQWGQMTHYAQTIKEVMVVPEVPRFFREDDELVLATKIINLTDNDLSATATLELLDAATQKPIDMLLEASTKTTTVTAQNNAAVEWKTKVPRGTEAIILRIKAVGNQHSDGEEHYIPVLPNRVMVSESLPILLNKKGKTVHHFKALEQSKNAEHHQLTFRYTQSAAWEVVKALPYLMEYPHECSEQLFSRLFGYAVGQHIVGTYPTIKQALELWEKQLSSGGKATTSPLDQNEELKALLLQETPWQQAGENETANRKRLLMLLDENYTNEQIRLAIAKLQELQLHSGEFGWFRGMGPDDYITRHLMIGFGQLKKMGSSVVTNNRVVQMVDKGLQHLQLTTNKRWETLSKDTTHTAIGADDLHLLYAMSFYTENKLSDKTKTSIDSMLVRMASQKPWRTMAEQAIAAMTFKRFGMTEPTNALMASLREKAVGRGTDMVWYRGGNGWHWTDNAVETQAMALQCFNELSPNDTQIIAMQNYLVAQKRTQSWPTTRSTTMAVWGMMSSPKVFENIGKADQISVGSIKIGKSGTDKQQMLSGTISKTWHGTEVKPSMGKVTINKQSEGQSWASLNWQYFSPIGEVKAASGPTSITKALFVQKQTDKGTQLIPIAEASPEVGDKVVVKLTITATQAMDYVHVKDMRSSLLEPVEVFSQYFYQNGLGYYRAGTDAAMNFFIGRLPQGTFTIEYELRITGKGNTTNGFATLQCMYAPEFESRSESGNLRTK
jgi:uncharacterized protein YfaS (alpha-2-macroglobulin family)